MVQLNGLTRKAFEASQHTFGGEGLRPEVPSSSSSGSTHHQEEQKKHWGDEIQTNVHKFPPLSWGFFEPNLPSAKAYLHELVQWCLEFLTIEVSLVCHVPFPKWPFALQFPDSSNAMINYEITLLGAGALVVDDAHGLGNLPDVLPHFIIHLLCCQATLILPNPHGFCCPLADSNTGVLGLDVDLKSQHRDCISICDD
jgi:hypothetical protein